MTEEQLQELLNKRQSIGSVPAPFEVPFQQEETMSEIDPAQAPVMGDTLQPMDPMSAVRPNEEVLSTNPSTNLSGFEPMVSEDTAPTNPKLDESNPRRDERSAIMDLIYGTKKNNTGNKALVRSLLDSANLAARRQVADTKGVLGGIEAAENLPLEQMKEEQNRATVEANIRSVDLSNRKAIQGEEDEMAARDPKSLRSRKFVKELADSYADMGEEKLAKRFEGLSYNDALALEKSFSDQLNKKIQMEQLKASRADKAEGKQKEKEAKQLEKLQNRYGRETKEIQNEFGEVDKMKSLTDELRSNPEKFAKGGIGKLAAQYGLAKFLDPGSVVRESELGLLGASDTVIGRFKQAMNNVATGKINQGTLDSINEIIALRTKDLNSRYLKRISPIVNEAQELSDPDYAMSKIAGDRYTSAIESKNSAGQAQSDMVQMEIPGGKIKMIPRKMVEQAKKNGAKEI